MARKSTQQATKANRNGKSGTRPIPDLASVKKAFAAIEEIRKRAKPLRNLTTKDLIEEGRR